jgi:[acyl-carrier-protein] S-malonyltransferase
MNLSGRGLALVFPGQGSQDVGMGRDLAEAFGEARQVYEEADSVLGFRLSALCFEGPKEELDDTLNTQPALFATSMAVLRVLERTGALPSPAMVAGHSLGELTALVAAGALEFSDGLVLVRERGRLMKLAGEQNPGSMAAVIKMDDEVVEEACRQASEEIGRVIAVANYNSPGQVVISGDSDALACAVAVLRAKGARRIVPLAVSIAAHSSLMAGAAADFRRAVEATPMRASRLPVIGNVGARPLSTVREIQDELAGQLTEPVQWAASVRWMIAQGATRFIEVGPKDVLSKLIQRVNGSVEAISIGDIASVRALSGQAAVVW